MKLWYSSFTSNHFQITFKSLSGVVVPTLIRDHNKKVKTFSKKAQSLSNLFDSISSKHNLLKQEEAPSFKQKQLMTVDAICNWFKHLEADWIAAFTRHKEKIRISFKKIYGNKKYVSMKQVQFSDAIQEEGMFPETIDTAIRAMKALDEGNNVALLGLIQSCKSSSQTISAMLFGVVHYLKTGVMVLPIFLLPSGDTYVGQFRHKLEIVTVLFNDAEITIGKNNSVLVKDYYQEYVKSRRSALSKDFADVKDIVNDRNKVANLLDDLNVKEHYIMPVSRKFQEVFKIIVNAVKQNNWRILLIRDESHNAVAKNSVNDDMFGGAFEEMLEDDPNHQRSPDDQAIYDMIRDKHVQVMAVSATNWVALMEPFVPVPVALNNLYCGLDFRYYLNNRDEEGLLVAKGNGVKIKLPEIVGLREFSSRVGNSDIKHLKGGLYSNIDNFDKYLEDHPDFPFRSHEEYKDRCNKAISDACKWLIVHNPKNTDASPKRGILLRLHNQNNSAKLLANYLDKSLSGVKVIRYFDDNSRPAKFTTIPALMKRNNVGPNDFYLIIATARARMSDSFPINCSYGIDLTRKSSTLAALLQGVLGRMCGYNKNPLIILSDSNEKRIREYIESDYTKWGGKALGTVGRRRPRAAMSFERKKFSHADIQMTSIFEKITKGIVLKAKPRGEGDKFQIIMGNKTPACLFDILDENDFNYLSKMAECETGYKLIGKHEVDRDGGQYKLTSKRYVAGTVRMQLGKKDSKQGGRQGKQQDATCLDGEYRVMYRVGVKKYGTKYTPYLVGFDLALFRRPQSQGDLINNSICDRVAKAAKTSK